MGAVTLLPDTNVWRYLVDADAIEDARLLAKASGVKIVACPAVVYECLRIGDAALRQKLAKALTRNDWLRPMPEAFVEAEAVRTEVARLHPEWLKTRPDLHNYLRNRDDWRGAFWRRVRQDPKTQASILCTVEGDTVSFARAEAETVRAHARGLGHSERSLRLATATAWFSKPVPGWDGEPFEAWRALSQGHWWDAAILARDPTASDWLSPWLDLQRMRREQDVWTHMWTREVSSERLPREWLRWAMREAQALRKVTPGTPVDNQISTYLLDFDVFLTSDRAFGDCLKVLRPHAPAPLATIATAPGGTAAVEFTLELLTALAARVAADREVGQGGIGNPSEGHPG